MANSDISDTDTSVSNSLQCELLELGAIRDLCDKVALQILDSDFEPDTIIAIARGGLVPARFIADTLGISSIPTMTVRHYSAGAVKNEAAYVAHPVNADISQQKVLVVDDVNDTGDTFTAAFPHIQSHSPAQVKTVVVHEKLVSSYRADFVGETQEDWRWLVYPWALVEDVGSFVQQLMPDALDRVQLEQRLFSKYGLRLPPNRLDHILSLYIPYSERFLSN